MLNSQSMVRIRMTSVLLVVVGVLAAACGSVADDTGVESPAAWLGCEQAPEDQRHSHSQFPLSVSANPVAAGDVVSLIFGSNETPGGDNTISGSSHTGWGSLWQCWNGIEWVDTHLLEHGTRSPGEVIARDPEVVTTMPAIGMSVPNSFEITVPNVDMGWYRIEADVLSDTEGSLAGYVVLEVISHP